MELPFAVESSTNHVSLQTPSSVAAVRRCDNNNEDDAGSLVMASSQGSLLQSQETYKPNHQSGSSIFSSSRLAATGSRVASVLSHFTSTAATTVSNSIPQQQQQQRTTHISPAIRSVSTAQQHQQQQQQPLETIDFTYVNVFETDADEVDIFLPLSSNNDPMQSGNANLESHAHGDILTLLLNRVGQHRNVAGGSSDNHDAESNTDHLVQLLEQANDSGNKAAQAKRRGELQQALDHHTASAKLFHQAAVLSRQSHDSMANSLLLLSQVQAKSAVALQRAVKLRPNSLASLLQQTLGKTNNDPANDLSESTFLGKAVTGPTTSENMSSPSPKDTVPDNTSTGNSKGSTATTQGHHNPVDEMMALERELRDMDMALELGNSIASLESRNQSRAKGLENSFMLVTPGSNSYMSSSSMWSPLSTTTATAPRGNTSHASAATSAYTATAGSAGVRARANRVQNILESSTVRPLPNTVPTTSSATSPTSLSIGAGRGAHAPYNQQQQQPPHNGLESSWWGSSSVASQALTSSVISLASSTVHDGGGHPRHHQLQQQHHHPTNTKQLMQFMDALNTLKHENDNLLREVEQAKAARQEAKLAQDEMRRFRDEYGKRFAALRQALKTFRQEHAGNDTSNNPVSNSEFVRSESNSEQLQRQESLIKKLTTDLKKEKDENKKKDAALRKYESFYREVKARSAQKAEQRQKQTTHVTGRHHGVAHQPQQPFHHGGS